MTTSMNISLPVSLKNWIEGQVQKKGYSTASEYVREILRREQAHEARRRVDSKLLAALDSGPPTPMTARDWQDIRREGRKRAAARRGK